LLSAEKWLYCDTYRISRKIYDKILTSKFGGWLIRES